jgi:hypothetical protein
LIAEGWPSMSGAALPARSAAGGSARPSAQALPQRARSVAEKIRFDAPKNASSS